MADTVRYYMDEHIARAVIRGLRHRGIDVLTASEANKLSASDEDHLQFAAEQNRVVVTQDQDFLRLHAVGVAHAGIVYAPQRTPIGAMVSGLVLIHQMLAADEMRGHVEFL